MKRLVCPECGASMVLKNSRYGKFYGCSNWPECTATHGAHKDGRPLGRPASKDVRRARVMAHDAFDVLWKEAPEEERQGARTRAYEWLRRQMHLTERQCHIGRFGEEECRQVIALCEGKSWEDVKNG